MTTTNGEVADGFDAVRDAFTENFSARNEIGAAFSAYHDGRKVVDLWGGDAKPGVAWAQDSMTIIWSATKGVSALVAQLLADRGELEIDALVTRYWPEFGVNGKENITVRDVLSHGARLPYPPGYSAVATADSASGWDDVSGMVDLLEKASPVLPEGAHGYHAVTFGLLFGEIARRATGRSVGTILAEDLASPLGLDTHIGLPAGQHGRVADLQLTIPPPPTDDPEILAMMAEAMGPNGPVGQALMVGEKSVTNFAEIGNSVEMRSAEQPAAGGISDARSLARMYSMLASGGVIDGQRIVSEESITAHRAEQWRGTDATLGDEKRYATGYMLAGTPAETFGPNPDAFGHPGMGGSLGFADPEAGVGYGYVMNHMIFEVAVDPRARALADALYSCL